MKLISIIFFGATMHGCNQGCPEDAYEEADGTCIAECPDGYSIDENAKKCVEQCGQNLRLTGTFQMDSATLGIDANPTNGLEFQIEHKIDIDLHEAGCVDQISLAIKQGGLGCKLELDFESNGSGGFELNDINFNADSYCPNFDDNLEGEYEKYGPATTRISGLPDQVPMETGTEESVCINDFELRIEADGELQLDDTGQHDFQLDLVLKGDARSAGFTDATCQVGG